MSSPHTAPITIQIASEFDTLKTKISQDQEDCPTAHNFPSTSFWTPFFSGVQLVHNFIQVSLDIIYACLDIPVAVPF